MGQTNLKPIFFRGLIAHLAVACLVLIAGIVLAVQGQVFGPLICLAALIYFCVTAYMYGFAYYYHIKDQTKR